MNIEIVIEYECDKAGICENDLRTVAVAERFIEKLQGKGIPSQWFQDHFAKYSGDSYEGIRDSVKSHIAEHSECKAVYQKHSTKPEWDVNADLGKMLRVMAFDVLKEKDPKFDSLAWDYAREELADQYFQNIPGLSDEQRKELKGMLYSSEGFEQAFHPAMIMNEAAKAEYEKRKAGWRKKKGLEME